MLLINSVNREKGLQNNNPQQGLTSIGLLRYYTASSPLSTVHSNISNFCITVSQQGPRTNSIAPYRTENCCQKWNLRFLWIMLNLILMWSIQEIYRICQRSNIFPGLGVKPAICLQVKILLTILAPNLFTTANFSC